MAGHNITQNRMTAGRAIISALVLWLAFSGVAAAEQLYVNEGGWWREGGAFNVSSAPIQTAVDAAAEGDAIYVDSGSYTENVDVNKTRLTLQGEGADVVTVTAADSGDHVFEVTADYVNISGFTATGATDMWVAGVSLTSADHCNISRNIASNNYDGIYMSYSNDNTLTNNTANSNRYGIYLYESSDNTLTSNTASKNDGSGIYLHWYSSDNTLTSNTALDNYYGIRLCDSSNNTLTDNTMSGNGYNFGVTGNSLSEYSHNIDTSNTVDGKPIYYWVDQHDNQIPSDAGFVGVVNSTNITVSDLTLTNNVQGVLFAYTENSRAENAVASNNSDGIYLYESSNNTLTSNTASNNSDGIHLRSSSNNNLTSNTANSNNYDGIHLYWYSSNNTLAGNTVSNNSDNGIRLTHSINNTLTNNIASNNNCYGICLYESSNNTLTNDTANSNRYGIILGSSSNNTLTGNTANSNQYGIWLSSSNSNNNLIYNNYFDNTNNAYDVSYDGGYNIWSTTKTAGTNIVGGLYLGGNYWSDYAGVDTDGDGLGDTLTPYNSSGDIATGGDWHPLVQTTSAPAPTITSFAPPPSVTGPPHSVTDTEGATRTFSITVDQTVNVSWLINGTEAQTNESVTSAVYTNASAAPGVWNVSAIASNANGTAMQTWWWTVLANTPPHKPSNPSPSNGATDVNISTDLSWTGGDPEGDSVVYDVYFEMDDGSLDECVSDDQSGTTYDPGTLSYSSTYSWKVVAKDEHGSETEGDVWEFTTRSAPTPPNQPPTASFTFSPSYPFVGHLVTFDGSGSSDPDGTITNYEWNFGDGNTSTGMVVTHSYSSAGTYAVTLEVTDNGGRTGTKAIDVQYGEQPTRGDVNGDGYITSADAAIALEIAVGSRPCDAATLDAADVNGDGSVTSLDALMILQAAAGGVAVG